LAACYPLAIVTSRTRSDAAGFLDRFGLTSFFGTIVARGSTRRLKPDPGPVELAAVELGVSVERCLMVGDTTPDILSARRAGAIAVAVLCGYGERRELQRAGAHAIIESTAQLPELLLPEHVTTGEIAAPPTRRAPTARGQHDV
jgi:phosphoglycolate phosphatase-like HAD superfamily hydrolase